MDETEAILGLKQGQLEGLETLVRLHQKRALQVSFAICQDYSLAEDIVQTAFVRSYERIRQFDPALSFKPWFIQIVVNETLKAL
jgi:RNA polymerase sigma-70 factor (ECF subfamily)